VLGVGCDVGDIVLNEMVGGGVGEGAGLISVVLVSRVGAGVGAGVYAGDGTFGDGAAVFGVGAVSVVVGAGVVETGLGRGVVVVMSFIGVGGTLGHVEPLAVATLHVPPRPG